MKKKLLLLLLSSVLFLPTFAESMCVNLKNDETVSFDLEDIKDVTICETIHMFDESETPLKFRILSDNTVEVIRDDSYQELDSVIIPAKVRIDGKIYDVTSIGYEAFFGCSGLTSINIPESVTSIGIAAFSYCSGLTSINIPESVTYIGDVAFLGCTNLDIVIDNSKDNVKVGDGAFQGCKSVTYLK